MSALAASHWDFPKVLPAPHNFHPSTPDRKKRCLRVLSRILCANGGECLNHLYREHDRIEQTTLVYPVEFESLFFHYLCVRTKGHTPNHYPALGEQEDVNPRILTIKCQKEIIGIDNNDV